jgi:hypothetical protein
MENQHPVLTQLNQEIQDLKDQVTYLRSERDRILTNYSQDVENTRAILIEAIVDGTDVRTLANSIADVFAISLLKSITVSIPLTVEATLLVPANFDIDDLQITDVGMDADNIDVEEFSVESWDIGRIEEI